MPVARIFAESASDAAPLAAHLRALGYTIELASPDSDTTVNADLEIRLERCNFTDALQQAKRRARELGADIYVAANALEVVHEPSPVMAPALNTRNAAEQEVARSAELRDSLSPAVVFGLMPEAGAGSQVLDQPFVPANEPLPEPVRAECAETAFQSGPIDLPRSESRAPVETATAQAHDPAATYTTCGEPLQPAPSLTGVTNHAPAQEEVAAAVLSRAAAAVCSSFTVAGAATARGFAATQSKLRQSMSAVTQSYSRRRMRAQPATQTAQTQIQIEAPRPFSLQQEVQPTPPAAVVAPPPPAAEAFAPASTPRAHASIRPLPWLAFAASGAAAVAILLTWSVVAGHPAAPSIPVNGNIEQQVPFGAVKIHPQAQPPRTTAAPARAVVPAVGQPLARANSVKPSPAIRANAKPPQPAHDGSFRKRSSHRTARQRPADDDVIVHHYGKPTPPPKAQLSSTGVKHISDQE
jgi:hypothetical protein